MCPTIISFPICSVLLSIIAGTVSTGDDTLDDEDTTGGDSVGRMEASVPLFPCNSGLLFLIFFLLFAVNELYGKFKQTRHVKVTSYINELHIEHL